MGVRWRHLSAAGLGDFTTPLLLTLARHPPLTHHLVEDLDLRVVVIHPDEPCMHG